MVLCQNNVIIILTQNWISICSFMLGSNAKYKFLQSCQNMVMVLFRQLAKLKVSTGPSILLKYDVERNIKIKVCLPAFTPNKRCRNAMMNEVRRFGKWVFIFNFEHKFSRCKFILKCTLNQCCFLSF